MDANLCQPSHGSASPPLNILLIYADDLGFGDVGCYGAQTVPTPHLDALAAEGMRFTQSYATAATCTPSRYSLLTGQYPFRNPQARILSGDAPLLIRGDECTLPRLLKDAGYRSAVIGKWHLGLGDGALDWNGDIQPGPLEVGFDESYIMAGTNDRVPCVYVEDRRVHGLDPEDPLSVSYARENPFPEVPTGRDHPEGLTIHHSDQQHWDTIVNGVGRIGFSRGGEAALWNDETMSDVFLNRAKDFISRHKQGPFFLYYALHQPHVPRIPGPRFQGRTGLGPRGDVIAELDDCVGQMIQHLKQEGLDKNTLLVFSSDNGPILDDGYIDEAVERCGEHRPAGGLRGWKYSVLEGGAKVPMIVWAPGRVPEGDVSSALFSQVDFPASLATVAGLPRPAGLPQDSQDMSGVLLGTDPRGRESLVTQGAGAKTVYRKGKWNYIPPHPGPPRNANKDIETGCSPQPQLYDLDQDPGQAVNLADGCPGVLEELRKELEAIQGRPVWSPPQTA